MTLKKTRMALLSVEEHRELFTETFRSLPTQAKGGFAVSGARPQFRKARLVPAPHCGRSCPITVPEAIIVR